MNQREEDFTVFIIPLPVTMEDEIEHVANRPFCNSSHCPCHADTNLLQEQIYQPVKDGLLTDSEAIRLYWGRQIA